MKIIKPKVIEDKAVPDMIDALIDSYYEISAQVNQWGARREQHMMYPTLMSISEALQKAGCLIVAGTDIKINVDDFKL